MKRPSPPAAILPVLGVLLACGLTAAQSGPKPVLEVGFDDGGGTSWTSQPGGEPLSLYSGEVRVRTEFGTWSALMMRTWVDDTSEPGSAAAQVFWTQYPWLSPPQPYDGATTFNVPQWQGAPALRIDPGLVALNMQNAAFHPTLAVPHPDAVRWCFQPAVDPVPGEAAMGHRVWDARAPVWLSDPTGDGAGPAMAALWGAYVLDATQSTIFAFEAFAIMGIYLQAPVGGADPVEFLKGSGWTAARNLGIHVTLQALTARSSDPSAEPTLDELTTPGLTGIEFLQPVSTITNPVTVQLVQGIPLGTGGGTPDVRRGQRFHFRATGLCAPSVATIPVAGAPGATVQRPVTWNTTYFTPFAANVVIPLSALLGTQTIGLQNGLGLANTSALHANILPIEPIQQGG